MLAAGDKCDFDAELDYELTGLVDEFG